MSPRLHAIRVKEGVNAGPTRPQAGMQPDAFSADLSPLRAVLVQSPRLTKEGPQNAVQALAGPFPSPPEPRKPRNAPRPLRHGTTPTRPQLGSSEAVYSAANRRYRIHLHKNGRELVITRSPKRPRQPLPLFDVAEFDWPRFRSWFPYDWKREGL